MWGLGDFEFVRVRGLGFRVMGGGLLKGTSKS